MHLLYIKIARFEFQFTPLCEGRLGIFRMVLLVCIFQFTPLCEGRQRFYTKSFRNWEFQFTPMCEGRPLALI